MEFSTATKSEYSNIPVKKRKEYISSVLFNRGTGILTMEYSIATKSDYSNIPDNKRKECILSVLFNRGYRHINYGVFYCHLK